MAAAVVSEKAEKAKRVVLADGDSESVRVYCRMEEKEL